MEDTRNFKAEEFRCKCCGAEIMDQDFIDKLQRARDISGEPFYINSGYRCRLHNNAVGGVSDSSHLIGYAADIKAIDWQKRYVIIDGLMGAGVPRIKIRKTYIHADDDPNKYQPILML